MLDTERKQDIRQFPTVDWTRFGVPKRLTVYQTGDKSFAMYDGTRQVSLDLTDMRFSECDRAIRMAVELLSSARRRKLH